MHQEIEIKVFLKNPEDVRKNLDEKTKFIKEEQQVDEWFSLQHKDFFNKVPAGEGVRVRHKDNGGTLAYFFSHPGEGGTFSLDEYETSVNDSRVVSEIFTKLDMYVRVTVTKTRRKYAHEGFEICLDYIEELGWFIEIEAEEADDRSDVSVIWKREKEILDMLGVIGNDVTKKGGYPDLILHKELLDDPQSSSGK